MLLLMSNPSRSKAGPEGLNPQLVAELRTLDSNVSPGWVTGQGIFLFSTNLILIVKCWYQRGSAADGNGERAV